MESILTKKQTRMKSKDVIVDGEKYRLVLEIRYDDEYGNGHNTFTITLSTHLGWRSNYIVAYGCQHELVAEHFPEYAHMIKWHGCTSDGPLYYIANTLYHACKIEEFYNFVYLQDKEFKIKECVGVYDDIDTRLIESKYSSLRDVSIIIKREPRSTNKAANIEAARACAIWPSATLQQLQDVDALTDRLPDLLEDFKVDIEALGLIY